jgi:hypothetical protein
MLVADFIEEGPSVIDTSSNMLLDHRGPAGSTSQPPSGAA